MLAQYASLLTQVCTDRGRSVDGYSLLTDAAKTRVADPVVPLKGRDHVSLVNRFLDRAAVFPDRVAVDDGAHEWSYAELERLTRELADQLRARGVRRGDVVGIYAHRSALFVLALLGVLRAGAAFCVFDPGYPALRLAQNLRAARPRFWIRIAAAGAPPESVLTLLAELVGERMIDLPLSVDRQAPLPVADDVEPVDIDHDAPAYVTFTSGTTGQPKCVVGTSRPLSHFLEWHCEQFGLTENDRFSMLSGLAHDPLLRDVFTPLWLGARLCIPQADEMLKPGYLAGWLHKCEISISHLTPAMGTLVAETASRQLPALRYLFFGGDTLTTRVTALVHRVAPAAQVVNFYGTTETPQAMAWHRVDSASMVAADERAAETSVPVPIGTSIPDVQLLILNRAGGLAGVGELGEIFVRTPYLTLGYANDQKLTRDRFVANPFTEDEQDRLYRTGDMARYRPDGLVEFAGREDQVKIRGYRVELGEVEVVLGTHKDVRQCVVASFEESTGEHRLAAYLVCTDETKPSTQELRAHVGALLPDYMVPSAFVFLEAIPLTPNGKIDRRSLPAPFKTTESLVEGYVAPRNDVEAAMAGIWSAVLGVTPVSVFADFFQLGGHSLLATRLIARIKARLGIDLPLKSLFVERTIAGLSMRIKFNESTQAYQYRDDNTHPWKRLVPAQTKGTRIPFFFAAGYMDADDTLRVLSHIIPHLGMDQPVYGFQPRWLDGQSERYSSVEEVASEFVAELRAFQPDGPYFLGGDCASGVIALEMARELQRQGAEVGILVMFDTERPSPFRERAADLRLALRRARHIGETIWEILTSDIPAKKRIIRELFHRKMLALQPPTEREARESEADRVNRLRTDYRRMIYRHRVQEYRGPITLFICEHIYRFDKSLGWAGAAPGGLEVHVVPGDHWTRYVSHGKDFSALLDACFRRAQRQIDERSGQSGSRSVRALTLHDVG
jgi:amino acid adenylation domain-containing protein